jgi:hypothetical protein
VTAVADAPAATTVGLNAVLASLVVSSPGIPKEY